MSKHESDSGHPSQTSRSTQPAKYKQAMSVVAGGAHGAASMVKTSVLRRDRLDEASYQARLDVCRNCPGGHATFKDDGSLHTCGPMLKSLKGEGKGTCGCVLNKKARDAKETCPFGYWPTLQSKDLPATSPEKPARPAAAAQIITPRKDIVTPQQFAMQRGGFNRGRRQFIGKSVAALAGLAFTNSLFAIVDNDTYYLPVSACDSGSGTHVACDDVPSSRAGDVFEASEDGNCYTVQGTTPVKGSDLTSAVAVTPASGTWAADCSECDPDPAPCSCPSGLASSYSVELLYSYSLYTGADCSGSASDSCTSVLASMTVDRQASSCSWVGWTIDGVCNGAGVGVVLSLIPLGSGGSSSCDSPECTWQIWASHGAFIDSRALASKDRGLTPTGSYVPEGQCCAYIAGMDMYVKSSVTEVSVS